MDQQSLSAVIRDQTERALWEVKNVIDCVPDALWDRPYCDAPLWQHIYHMLHSLDLWLVNPRSKAYTEPAFHVENLNNLDVPASIRLSRGEIDGYYLQIAAKIRDYTFQLRDNILLDRPESCEYTAFTLILAQLRHLHTHMGILMGFLIADSGLWPRVVGLENEIPRGAYDRYF